MPNKKSQPRDQGTGIFTHCRRRRHGKCFVVQCACSCHSLSLILLNCMGKCRGAVTEHTQISDHTAQCLACASERDTKLAVLR